LGNVARTLPDIRTPGSSNAEDTLLNGLCGGIFSSRASKHFPGFHLMEESRNFDWKDPMVRAGADC
jgi:hypothetical protein